MDNYKHSGRTMEFTAPSGGLTSGQVYKVQDTVGVVVADTAYGDTAVMNLDGVYSVPKAAVAFTKGARIWWDNSALAATTATGSNTLIGVADETVASGVTEAAVRWNGSF